MIKIQVLGTGMIPRDLGIAPRLEPFYADMGLIYTILQTPGLKVNYLHPENGRFFPMNTQNMKAVLDKFKNVDYNHTNVQKEAVTKPHVPEEVKKPETVKPTPPAPPAPSKPVTPQQDTPKAAEKPATPPEVKNAEIKKDDTKAEEKKSDDKKPEEKKDEKVAQTGGLKPVVGQGQNAQEKKPEEKK